MKSVKMDYGEYIRDFGRYQKIPDSYDYLRYEVGVMLPDDLPFSRRKFIAVRLPYPVYKREFSGKYYRHCDYEPKTKSIVCFLPEDSPYIEKYKHLNDIAMFRQGFVDSLHIEPDRIDAESITVEVPECLLN